MSTATIPEQQHGAAPINVTWQNIREHVLRPMGSLKVTCVLLAVSMFLVFVGSLAQARRDVWMVVGEYFRCWIAWVQVKDLFPPSMFPSMIDYDWNGLGRMKSFPYPGGWLIGTAMCLNLLAAHIYRIKLAVKGKRLMFGIAAMTAALAVTALIIDAGNATGLQSEPLLGYDAVWMLMLGSLAAITVGSGLMTIGPFAANGYARWLWGTVSFSTLCLLGYFVFKEDARLTNESMRILWQLLEGSIAASALLIGCTLLFRKRGGIVLLHLGIVMLMFSEWQVAKYGRENQMTLTEGETATFLRDIRERELAIVERDGDESRVWVIPEHQLRSAGESGDIIDQDILPFPIRVREFFINSELKRLDGDAELPAAAGLGAVAMAVEQNPRTGMDELPDISSVYIDILDRSDKSVVATHMVSQEASELRGEFAERVKVGEKTYDLYLRSMRTYRPWTVKLLDVSRTNYIGTNTPKDFRSTFVITERDGKEHEYTTWMNNPVRFGGETFYQQGYQNIPGTGEVTTLQVVRNTGWMLPYIGCMVVAFGMFAQFGQTLLRFLNREARKTSSLEPTTEEGKETPPVAADTGSAIPATPRSVWLNTVVPVAVIMSMTLWIVGKAAPRSTPEGTMDIREAARIPVAAGGRTQPLETFAQNSLLSISGKSTFEGEMEPAELDENREKIIGRIERIWPDEDWSGLESFKGTYEDWIQQVVKASGSRREEVEAGLRPVMAVKRSAVWWLMDVLTRPEVAERHRVFRIVDDQLLALLNLEKRPGFAYAASEFREKLPDLKDIYNTAHQLLMDEEGARLTPLQRRVHTLIDDDSKVRFFPEVFNGRPDDESASFGVLVETWRLLKLLQSRPVTLSVPTGSEDARLAWESGVAADAIVKSQEVLDRLGVTDVDEAVEALLKSLPRDTVAETIDLTIRMLSQAVKDEQPGLSDEELAMKVRERAAGARDAEQLSREPYLQKIMKVIEESPAESTAEQIVAELDDGKLKELTSDRPAPGALAVLEILEQTEDHRNNQIRSRLRDKMTEGANLNEALEREAVELVVDDLKERAGHLLFVENRNETTLHQANAGLQAIFAAWGNQDVEQFNKRVAEYHDWVAESNIPFLNVSVSVLGIKEVNKVSYESFINRFAPGYYTIFLYLTALILTFLSWITLRKSLWRSAMGVTVVAFIVHTFYLYARIQISGRPPVTNLYSSAVFIGWAVVLGSFIVECFTKLGLLNVIGCAAGASTLCMAWFLGIDEGDTLSVMQAVLDTQFWLATHVVCVTVGYAATFLAGLLSIGYCVHRMLRHKTTIDTNSSLLGKVIYGTICFALFFSFVGTVLGGLWADDSWGRFWGWDPKENGALLIVIWNALILHARWDKMIRDYGTAVLAVAGNIVTAWSWFGVNELGAGLHKYGFTEGRLKYLLIFAVANAVFMLLASATGVLFRDKRSNLKPE